MKKNFVLTTLGFLLVTLSAFANDVLPERVLWQQRPIALHIQTGHERIVHFPDDVRYWLPDHLKNSVSVIAANGVLYIQAHQDFASTRIRVQGLNSNTIYLIDVFADNKQSTSDTLIVMESVSVENLSKPNVNNTSASDWPIRLTRYAAQQLYAPERLLNGDPNIVRKEIDNENDIALIRGGELETRPIACWAGGGLFVTAVELRNATSKSKTLQIGTLTISPITTVDLETQLRGQWMTATLQHGTLGPRGNEDDVTVLYLVSDRPFVESFNSNGVDY